jgi:hypothetical protein
MDSPMPDTMTEAAAAISDGREISFPAATTATARITTEAKPSSAQAHRSVPAEKAKNEKR